MALQTGLIIMLTFISLLSLSVPVSISLIISAAIAITNSLSFDLAVFVSSQKVLTGIDSFSLLAVPFFILAGVMMNTGGIAQKLINLAQIAVGRVPGSLAHTNIVGNSLFGALSGSSVAASVAVGGVLGPIQKEEGYDPKFSAAANIASAPTGLIIPPSGILIIYSVISGSSVVAMIMGGYIPGLLWMFACMAVAYIIAKKNNYPTSERAGFKEALRVFLDSVPSLMLIVIIIGGISSGIFTATEASAIAVAYTFVLSVFIYRSIKLSQLSGIFLQACEMTAVIMFLIGASSVMSFVMSFTGIPNAIAEGMLSISSNPVIILLLINVVFLIVGTFMDLTPAVLIFTPIFLPVVESFGMHPVHFGLMMIMNLGVGNITPPVGSSLFSGCSVANLDMDEVLKYLKPFYLAIIVALLMVAFIPQLTLFLPRIMGAL